MRIVLITLLALAGSPAALAQGNIAPQVASERQKRVAGDFAQNYLRTFSAPNAVALRASPQFYGPRVRFHGRQMSRTALMQEKRRFVQRWPVRRYEHRATSVRLGCSPNETCRMRSLFDFAASNPRRGRLSRGTGALELDVSFRGTRPIILSEASRVVRRGRGS